MVFPEAKPGARREANVAKPYVPSHRYDETDLTHAQRA